MQPLDTFDKQLLGLLQKNNKSTSEELSKLVNLSPSAIQRRIARLRKEKIIVGDVSIISPEALDIGLICIVDVILENGNGKAIDRFKTVMGKCDEVSQCYYVTGTYDFVLVIHLKNMQHYEAFSKKHLMDNSNVKHFYTHVVMNQAEAKYR